MGKTKYNSGLFNVYLDGEKVWEYLETGRDVDELYPDHFRTELTSKNYKNIIQSYLLEGEIYTFVENGDYAITSFGRVYCCKYDRFNRPVFDKYDVSVMIRQQKYVFSKFFKKQGWKYDYNELLSKSIDNNWNRYVAIEWNQKYYEARK